MLEEQDGPHGPTEVKGHPMSKIQAVFRLMEVVHDYLGIIISEVTSSNDIYIVLTYLVLRILG